MKTTKRKTTVADLTIFARNDYTKLELSTKAFTFVAVADRNCNLKDWKTKRRKTSEVGTLRNEHTCERVLWTVQTNRLE